MRQGTRNLLTVCVSPIGISVRLECTMDNNLKLDERGPARRAPKVRSLFARVPSHLGSANLCTDCCSIYQCLRNDFSYRPAMQRGHGISRVLHKWPMADKRRDGGLGSMKQCQIDEDRNRCNTDHRQMQGDLHWHCQYVRRLQIVTPANELGTKRRVNLLVERFAG